MHTIFVISVGIIIAVIAKKRGRSLWGWGILGAVVFLVLDTIVALALLSVFEGSNAFFIYTFAGEKLFVSSAVVAVLST